MKQIVLSILLCFVCCISVSAQQNSIIAIGAYESDTATIQNIQALLNDVVLGEKTLYGEKATEQEQQQSIWSNELTSYDKYNIKKIYTVSNAFLKELSNIKNFENYLSQQYYYYYIPCSTKYHRYATVILDKEGKYNSFHFEYKPVYTSNEVIVKIITENINETITSVKYALLPYYDITIAYIVTENKKQYIIPISMLSNEIKEFGIVKNQIYTPEQFFNCLNNIEIIKGVSTLGSVSHKSNETMTLPLFVNIASPSAISNIKISKNNNTLCITSKQQIEKIYDTLLNLSVPNVNTFIVSSEMYFDEGIVINSNDYTIQFYNGSKLLNQFYVSLDKLYNTEWVLLPIYNNEDNPFYQLLHNIYYQKS